MGCIFIRLWHMKIPHTLVPILHANSCNTVYTGQLNNNTEVITNRETVYMGTVRNFNNGMAQFYYAGRKTTIIKFRGSKIS